MRTINGTATYEVTGWSYDAKTIAFLTPATAINLASLILLVVAMLKGKSVLYATDPTDPESLLRATKEIKDDGTKIVVELEQGGVYNFWKASQRCLSLASC